MMSVLLQDLTPFASRRHPVDPSLRSICDSISCSPVFDNLTNNGYVRTTDDAGGRFVKRLSLQRFLLSSVLIVSMACVAFGLAIALGTHKGVEFEFDQLVDSVGSNLFRIRGREGRVIEGTVTTASTAFTQEDVDRLRSGGGIVEVSAATDGLDSSLPQYGRRRYLGVTASYFSVHQLPLLEGRTFDQGETGVCVLSSEYAASAYPDEDPIGQELLTSVGSLRVCGVLAPLDPMSFLWPAARFTDVFLPVEDYCALFDVLIGIGDCLPAPYGNLWIRVDPSNPKQGIESILSILPPGSHLDSISTLYGFTFRLRRRIVMLYVLAAVALLFVGVVSAFAMSMTQVARQAQAIGIHRALGAPRTRPSLRILVRLLGCAAGGIAIGTGCALWLSPAFSRLLSITLRFGWLHLAGGGILLGAAAAAGLIPALHASRVPPVRAIRSTPLRFERSPLRGVGWLVTAAGIVGIASVLFVASLSDSLEATLRNLYGDMQPNVVAVTAGSVPGSALPPYDLSEDDIDALLALPSVQAVSGELHVVLSEALYDGDSVGSLYRVKSFGDPFLAGRLIAGRLPTSEELVEGKEIAVVGDIVAEKSFDVADPVGQSIEIDGRTFEIIGIFNGPRSSLQASNPGWKILIPAAALEDSNTDRFFAWVKMDPAYDVEATVAEIESVLAARHPDEEPARLEGPATEMGKMISVANGITFGLLRLGYLTLLVSAFALGSLFWAQTVRRQAQISLERTLGATAWRVFWGTFRSAFSTTCVAGLIALGLGVAGTFLVRDWFWSEGEFRFDLVWIVWTIATVLVASVIGGGLPALWAARLSPMEGIRKGRF